MHPDDAAAVALAAGGDEDAFRVLVERHSRSVFRLAFRMTGSPQDAEDVVQETFVRAYQQLARFESRSNFATWLYRIGFNCAIDHLRRRPKLEAAQAPEVLNELAPRTSGPTSEDLVFAGQIGTRVQQALNSLSEQERAAFLMRHFQGCSIDEICTALGLKTNAAKHSIFRAVKKMRAELQPLARVHMEGLQVDPSHPTDDELIDRLTEALTMEGDDAVPEPPAHFERVMWARIRPETTAHSRSRWTWRVLVPAIGLAAAVVIAVALGHQVPGTSTQQTTTAAVAQADPSSGELSAGDRVLLTALDEHLEQTEALLVELRNADRADLRWERTTADDLVAAGRLYRQSAEFAGRSGVVRMLDDLEPVLVEVARSSDRITDRDRDWLRTRITDDNLLFKVRAMSTDLKDLK